jgi:hypothetical protein
MAISTSLKREMKLKLTLKDARAIEIVRNIPVKRRDEIIEKYIILGEMVISHASIGTRKETVEDFFEPLRNDIETIREQLRLIVPTIATPARKGQVTVENIFNSLKEHFMDDSFEDVTRIGKYADILAVTSDTKTPILIELKDYSGLVPTEEIEKFWRDLERRGTRYGIFVSMRSGISKCSSCISIKTEMSKTAILVNNSELSWSGHLFAYYVIKKIAELESVKKKELKGEEVNKIITKVNNHIIEIQKNVEAIDTIQTIADSLRTTCKNRLGELIDFSDSLKRTLNAKIADIFEDLKKVEL